MHELLIMENCLPRNSLTGALHLLKLQARLPEARVIYCSATGASEPRNMGYMIRLGLWGAGTCFPDFQSFLGLIFMPSSDSFFPSIFHFFIPCHLPVKYFVQPRKLVQLIKVMVCQLGGKKNKIKGYGEEESTVMIRLFLLTLHLGYLLTGN